MEKNQNIWYAATDAIDGILIFTFWKQNRKIYIGTCVYECFNWCMLGALREFIATSISFNRK